jgi:hypothetical protein
MFGVGHSIADDLPRDRGEGVMRQKPWLVLIAMLCSWLLLPAFVEARQTVGGGIAGVVKDPTGAVLPGVNVEAASPALIEKVRSVVTDATGNYKIIDLRPGTYTVTFTLPGFSTVKREGVELTVGFTANVSVELKVGSLEETVTVTGATPVVDVQSAKTQSLMRAETLEALPSGMKDLTALTTLTLGATTSTLRNDVGGSQGELSTGIAIHGSRGDDSRTNYDGMSTNVFYGGAGGQQRIYKFNTVGVTETTIDTAASSVDTETGGANINMVPKDGGNKLSLLGLANYTTTGFSDSQLPSDLLSRQLATDPATNNTMKKVYDYGVGVGGPIMKDKIWFYSANRWWGNQTYAANNYFNTNGTPFYQYVPDKSQPAYSNQHYKDFGGRITLQATAKQKFTFSENFQNACACWMGIGSTTAPESIVSYLYGAPRGLYLTQSSWSYPATNRLLVQAGFSYLRQAVSFTSQGAASNVPGQIAITDGNYPGVGTYTWGGLLGSPQNDNFQPQQNDNVSYRYSTSYVTGSHAAKFGLQGQWGMYNTRGNVPGNGTTYQFNGGVPVNVVEYAAPFASNGRIKNLGLYASDQWTLKRLTLSYGVRFDHFNAGTLAIDVPAGPFIGARHFAAQNDIPNYKDITPRVGAAYDLFGNGKTAIKGSWGRYLLGLGGGSLSTLSPSNAIVTSTARSWSDRVGQVNPATGVAGNGNFVPDCNLQNPAANGECGAIQNAAFGTSNLAVTWDPRAAAGWGVREYNNQWSLSLQQEIRSNFGASVGFYHTDWQNGQISVSNAYKASDINLFCITAPTDPRLGPASGQPVCGLGSYTTTTTPLAPVNLSRTWMRPQDAGINGQRLDYFNGVELATNIRFKQQGVISGGVAIGREITDNCFLNNYPNVVATIATAAESPVGNRDPKYCRNVSGWWEGVGSQAKVQVVYPLPYNFLVSAVYKNLPGIQDTASFTVPNSVVSAATGRSVVGCGTAGAACPLFYTIPGASGPQVIVPSSVFDQRLNQTDLRLTRRFKIGRTRLTANADLYNAFNSRAPQSISTAWGTIATATTAAVPNPTFLRPGIYLNGRLFKVGGQIDW